MCIGNGIRRILNRGEMERESLDGLRRCNFLESRGKTGREQSREFWKGNVALWSQGCVTGPLSFRFMVLANDIVLK